MTARENGQLSVATLDRRLSQMEEVVRRLDEDLGFISEDVGMSLELQDPTSGLTFGEPGTAQILPVTGFSLFSVTTGGVVNGQNLNNVVLYGTDDVRGDCGKARAMLTFPRAASGFTIIVSVDAKSKCGVNVTGVITPGSVAPGKSGIFAVGNRGATVIVASQKRKKGDAIFSVRSGKAFGQKKLRLVQRAGYVTEHAESKLKKTCKTGNSGPFTLPAASHFISLSVDGASKCPVRVNIGSTSKTVSPGHSETFLFQALGGEKVSFTCQGKKASDPCTYGYAIRATR